MKTRLSLMLAIAGMIIAGAMLVGVVSANDPEPAEPQVSVLLHCNPDCKVLEDDTVQVLKAEIEALKAEKEWRQGQVDALYDRRDALMGQLEQVSQCKPDYRDKCWQHFIVDLFFPEPDDD